MVALLVLIPFRDDGTGVRGAQRAELLPALHAALERARPSGGVFRIFCATQSADGRRFNRGAVLNLGLAAGARAASLDDREFAMALSARTLVVLFHDVDLLPDAVLVDAYWRHAVALAGGTLRAAVHFASVWPRYGASPGYFGGVTMLLAADFAEIGGFPANAWGWGGEDDVLHARVVHAGLRVVRPGVGTLRDLEGLSLSEKLAALRAAPSSKCELRRELIAAARSGAGPPPFVSLCCLEALVRSAPLPGATELVFNLFPGCCAAHGVASATYDALWHATV